MSEMASLADPTQWLSIQKMLRNGQRYATALEKIIAIAGEGSPIAAIARSALDGKD